MAIACAGLVIAAIHTKDYTQSTAPAVAGMPIVRLASNNLEDTGLLPTQTTTRSSSSDDLYRATLDFPRLTT